MNKLLTLITVTVLITGCGTYRGVGNVALYGQAASDTGERTTILSGTFDNVIYKKRGQTFTLIAYRKATGEKFGQFWRSYKKDHPFVTAELRLDINRDGTIHEQPRFRLLQGERTVYDVVLEGDIGLRPYEKSLTITGAHLSLSGLDAAQSEPRDLSFELVVFNFLDPGAMVEAEV